MKKEVFALVLLTLILLGNLWNQRRLTGLTGEMLDSIQAAYEEAEEGRWQAAGQAAGAALELWEREERYRGVFLRHPESDDTTDALCDLMGAIRARDEGALLGAYLSVRARIRCLLRMEKLRLASVF